MRLINLLMFVVAGRKGALKGVGMQSEKSESVVDPSECVPHPVFVSRARAFSVSLSLPRTLSMNLSRALSLSFSRSLSLSRARARSLSPSYSLPI